MAFVCDPSQYSPGVISEKHGKPKSGWPDRESNPGPPECESSERYHCATSLDGFHGDLPFPPSLHSGAAPFSPRLTFDGSQDLVLKSRPNLSTQIRNNEDGEASCVVGGKRGGGRNFEFVSPRLEKLRLNIISACTRQKAKSKYRNRIQMERAPQNQSIDIHKTPYDRVKWCQKRKMNFKASERVDVDVFTQNKRPAGLLTCPARRGDTAGPGNASLIVPPPPEATRSDPAHLRAAFLTISASAGESDEVAFWKLYHVSRVLQYVVAPMQGRGHAPKGEVDRLRAVHQVIISLAIYNVFRKHLLASHQGEPGFKPGRVTPGFSQVGIVPDDATGRRVSSGFSRFPPPRRCSILASFHPHRLSRPRSATAEKRTPEPLEEDSAPLTTTASHPSRRRYSLVARRARAEYERLAGWELTYPRCDGRGEANITRCTPFTSFATYLIKEYLCLIYRDESPPSKVNRVQSPAESLPDFCKWESCRTIPLVVGFFGDLPFPLPIHYCAALFSHHVHPHRLSRPRC
ncbi:hypothetical protein PR048_003666 [Dryococelus australis]|uniref:Uncharacterized protein n=1 Tax=Dryococelus australis TaxID=614101 RepID=A0ABQ9INN6_9NEOP|nr:hypothetical protein PR048_003666 [Dryococelus australis]